MPTEEVVQCSKMVHKIAAVPPDIAAKDTPVIKDSSSPYGPSRGDRSRAPSLLGARGA